VTLVQDVRGQCCRVNWIIGSDWVALCECLHSDVPTPKRCQLWADTANNTDDSYSDANYLHCALASCGAVYCNWSCLWVCVCVCGCGCGCLWVCYHDNSNLHASIFTKLGLWVKVATISSWLNFGRCAPRERVCGGAKIFGSALLQPARSVCVSVSAFFI